MIIPVFGVMRQVQRKVDLETKEKRIRRALIEREVLVACAHPFVCNLYTAFQVRTYIGGCQEASGRGLGCVSLPSVWRGVVGLVPAVRRVVVRSAVTNEERTVPYCHDNHLA